MKSPIIQRNAVCTAARSVQRVTGATEQRSSTEADEETARGARSHVHIYARVHRKGQRGQYRHAILRALAGATAPRVPPQTPTRTPPGVAFPRGALPCVDPPQHNVTLTLSIC